MLNGSNNETILQGITSLNVVIKTAMYVCAFEDNILKSFIARFISRYRPRIVVNGFIVHFIVYNPHNTHKEWSAYDGRYR
jgi:hypothetical protein